MASFPSALLSPRPQTGSHLISEQPGPAKVTKSYTMQHNLDAQSCQPHIFVSKLDWLAFGVPAGPSFKTSTCQ